MSTNSTRKELSGHDVAVMERPVADVDTIEQFLREQFQSKPVGKGGQGDFSDPLMAELARIVGQDTRPAQGAAPVMPKAHDPFAASSDALDPLRAFEEELRRFDEAHRPAPAASEIVAAPEPVPELQAIPAPEIDVGLRGVEPQYVEPQYVEPAYYEPVTVGQRHDAPQAEAVYPSAPEVETYAAPAIEPEGVIAPDLSEEVAEGGLRSRKVLMMLGGAAMIAVVGVVGSIAFGKKSPVSGEATVIAAKTTPMKEKPADPGGVEVPGQDRQVLAKKTEEPKGAAQVVTKEEQPVDLNQTPKREVSRVILAAPAQGTPPAQAAPIIMPQGSQPAAAPAQPATAGGFEAKRVRSVKVNGDGEAAPAAAAPVAPAVPRPSTPTLATTPAPVAPAPKVEAPKVAETPKSDARPTTAARPVQQAAATTPQPVRPAAPRPTPAPAPAADAGGADAPMSLRPPSGASPARPAPRTASATPAAAAPAPTGGSGGFSVQLAAPGSETEARATATRLKQRYSDALDGYTPGVRKAEVGDKTVYRVRVGGLTREDANELCTKLKSSGGSCFVASN